MRISVAMATFNGVLFIREQLESLARQTHPIDQLVITDDASNDGTIEAILEFASAAPFPVNLQVNSARLGAAQNFGRALSLCDGDLILLSDQDDVWLPDKVATHVDAAINRPSASCWITDAFLADGNLMPTGATKMGQIHAAGLPATAMVMGCCASFRRELVQLLLPIPAEQPAHDNWMVQASDLLHLADRLTVPLQYYRRHGGNVSDFHVNRLDRPTFVERLFAPIGSMVRRALFPGGLEREQLFLVAAASRFEQRADKVRELVGVDTDKLMGELRSRLEFLTRRISARAMPRVARATVLLRLWQTGGYRHPGGLASALKDLTLP